MANIHGLHSNASNDGDSDEETRYVGGAGGSTGRGGGSGLAVLPNDGDGAASNPFDQMVSNARNDAASGGPAPDAGSVNTTVTLWKEGFQVRTA